MKLELISIRYCRAIASLMIVILHTTKNNSLFENEGILRNNSVLLAAMDIFFVISGFVMWYTTRSVESTPRKFISSRLTTIVPIYWIVMQFASLVAFLRPDRIRSEVFDVGHTVASLVFRTLAQVGFSKQYFSGHWCWLDAEP